MIKQFLVVFVLYWATTYAVANAAEERKVDATKWDRMNWSMIMKDDKGVSKDYTCTLLLSPDKLKAYVECTFKGVEI